MIEMKNEIENGSKTNALANHLYLVVNLIFLKVRRKQEGGGKEGKETIGNREKRIVGINGGMHATSLNWLKSDCAPGTIQKNCKLLTKLNFLPFTF